jgi:NAD(P)H-dependent flavin oxidoreductase YrpB (nitropropane dioxygenase family)
MMISLSAARLATPQRRIAPWAANLVTYRSYKRLQADLELVVKHKAPIVISALGSPAPVTEAVHGYGGLVFADGIIVLICTKSFTGAYANMLKPSILRAGLDPDALPTKESIDFDNPHSHAKPWKDIWSAGQCVGVIKQS